MKLKKIAIFLGLGLALLVGACQSNETTPETEAPKEETEKEEKVESESIEKKEMEGKHSHEEMEKEE